MEESGCISFSTLVYKMLVTLEYEHFHVTCFARSGGFNLAVFHQ